MKHFIASISLLFFGGISYIAGFGPNNLSQDDMDGGLFWKISGNGLQHNSYLLGTMHTVGGSFLDSIPCFRKIFLSVKQVAVECDLFSEDSIIRASKNRVYSAYSCMPQDTTYEMLYNRDDYHFVDSILRKGNPAYFRYKPLFWHSLFGTIQASQKNRKKETSMDRFILLIGYQNNKKIHFMETLKEIDKRATYLDSIRYSLINLQQQANALCAMLRAPDSISIYSNMVEKLYKEKKLSSILAIDSVNKQSIKFLRSDKMDGKKQNTADFLEIFYTILGPVRNEKWMDTLLPMIKEESSLIAVGAMHLVGKNGLINKLRKLGYTVEPVKE